MASQDSNRKKQKSAASPWRKRFGFLTAGLVIIGACVAAKLFWKSDEAGAQPQRQSQPNAAEDPYKPVDPVALVNGEPVTRAELAADCIKAYGGDVLESVINKHLIYQHCQSKGIVIPTTAVQAEVAKTAKRFGMSVEEWRNMLKNERHISPSQYDNDIIWPALALRAAAKDLLDISEEELLAFYHAMYGPTVDARIMVCRDRESAVEAVAAAKANPQDFGRLARQYSIDASASREGYIPPIRRNLGDPEIERVAFGLQAGQVSDVIEAEGQFIILKCESHHPSRTKQFPFENVRDKIKLELQSKKETMAATEVFGKLREKSNVVVVFEAEDERLPQQYPGVAAIVNGRQISMSELGEACLDRHGLEILEGTISRRLLEQNIQRHQILVERQDLVEEVSRAAESMGVTDAEGKVDIDRWVVMVEREQEIKWQRYLDDVVWPTVALKKLAHKVSGLQIEVTEEDLQFAFEANYGPRVIARAIMVNNLRTAQEAWELARKNPTLEYFGQLSTRYSVEASLRSLQGEIPPIQKHGGKPQLEEKAFALKPGELSGVIEVGDYYVILYCEGMTEPQTVSLGDVRDGLYRDLYEKKLRIQMAKVYQSMTDDANVTNYLSVTSAAAAAAFETAATDMNRQ
ncbi:MAG: peptidyl-prolyl cis-trans isomerase [Pirellulales bacterium]|nr:peptidyl-prolyl cis-trans isomerase [Pirellulales bacterium]